MTRANINQAPLFHFLSFHDSYQALESLKARQTEQSTTNLAREVVSVSSNEMEIRFSQPCKYALDSGLALLFMQLRKG